LHPFRGRSLPVAKPALAFHAPRPTPINAELVPKGAVLGDAPTAVDRLDVPPGRQRIERLVGFSFECSFIFLWFVSFWSGTEG
jgi:hypothetical protein